MICEKANMSRTRQFTFFGSRETKTLGTIVCGSDFVEDSTFKGVDIMVTGPNFTIQ